MNVKYIGHINCDKCGYQHITDPASVVIWYALDASEQLCEVKCPGCSQIISSRIDEEDYIAFLTHNVQKKFFGDKFTKLTEEDINDWDLDKELKSVFD